jgi:hypothetical protein
MRSGGTNSNLKIYDLHPHPAQTMNEEEAKAFDIKFGFNPFECHPERNWPEDYEHENGNYINTCSVCKLAFRGHKRRVWCRMCTAPDWDQLAAIQRPDNLPGAYSGCWLQGEMVGFSRCMVKVVKPLEDEVKRLKEIIAKIEPY